MFLPVAMEALDVPVPKSPEPFTEGIAPYGWVGSINKATKDDFIGNIQAFTKDNALLGSYFGDKGWPIYNIPADANGDVKIPSGQNIFGESPLSAKNSKYDINTYMLSSGGTAKDPIRVNIGGQGDESSGK